MLEVCASGAAMAKLSTWRRKSTRRSSNVPEYRQGSCTVGVRPISQRILSACFSHRRGDSGRPCMADRTGIIAPSGIGSRLRCLVHQLQKARSSRMKNGCLGRGALSKALDTSAPKINRFSANATA